MKEANKTRQQTQREEIARVQDAIKTAAYSLQSDPDDDMDTADVEEGDWIENIKRSTRDTEDKIESRQNSMLD